MNQHRLLARQIKKYFPDGMEGDESLQKFIQAVNDSYFSFDKDKELADHAFGISEREYIDIQTKLMEEVEVRRLSIDRINAAISQMETSRSDQVRDDKSLLDVVSYLQEQISKRRQAELAMQAAMYEAEKASIVKSEFLSIMSHEIRTPLNAVIGLCHILLRDPRPDQLQNLHVLRTSADNLLALINDILDFSKIEAGKLELEHSPFDLPGLVRDLLTAMDVKSKERSNRLVFEAEENIPARVVGDPLRLMQVLNNLLSNAVKFTQNGDITLSLRLREMDQQRCTVHFAVADTGVGIDENIREHIFKPFNQASSSITRQFGGTGLGLAITSELLQLMGSNVKVDTKLGKGSTFHFDLTFEYLKDQVRASEEKAIIQHDLDGAHVLLVEDTPFNVLFATQLLEGWNTTVDVAENGRIAVDMMKEGKYDFVLMDLQMPEMDGYTATRKIRKFDQHTPIIALTASVSTDVREKIAECGMQDYVSKPFNPDDLFHFESAVASIEASQPA